MALEEKAEKAGGKTSLTLPFLFHFFVTSSFFCVLVESVQEKNRMLLPAFRFTISSVFFYPFKAL